MMSRLQSVSVPKLVAALAFFLVSEQLVEVTGHGGHSADYFSRGSSYGYGYGPSSFSLSGHFGGVPDEREVYPEWFDVNSAEDCDNVPDSVNTGKPRGLCDDANVGEKFCICVKRGGSRRYAGNVPAKYEPICGTCRDPCALRFIPDPYPTNRKRTNTKNNNNNNDNDNADLTMTIEMEMNFGKINCAE